MLTKDMPWFTSPDVPATIRKLNANVAIMATTYVSLEKGLTNENLHETEIKRAMIDIAEKVILVADSSKMHHHTLNGQTVRN